MKEFNYTITDSLGIHARPAGLLVKEASHFKSNITLTKEDKTADAKKIFSVMSLGVKCGNTVTVNADGEDENEAISALESFFKTNL